MYFIFFFSHDFFHRACYRGVRNVAAPFKFDRLVSLYFLDCYYYYNIEWIYVHASVLSLEYVEFFFGFTRFTARNLNILPYKNILV